ncbi:MAG: glycosyltransferase family 2 protein [Brevinematia bacterium]
MKLSVIMPVFNGENFIVENTKRVVNLLNSYVDRKIINDFEVIVVDDGSKDNTLKLLKENFSNNDKVLIVENKFNQGKGFALKNGFFNSVGDVVVLIDSDLDIPPDQIESLINEYRKGYDVVITSKFEKGSEIKYPFMRRIISFGYYLFIKILFGLPFKDTQTGLKLIKREVLEICLNRMVVKRFAFDLELLTIAYRYNFSIKSIPVKINYHGKGFVSPKVLIMSFIDTLAIFYRLKILQFYDRPVFVSREIPFNFYFFTDKELIGINCQSKDLSQVDDGDYIILKRYDINYKLDLGILSSIISSYRLGVINGVIMYNPSDLKSELKLNILGSYFLIPIFNISHKIVMPRILPIPVSEFLCISGKVLKYLLSESIDFNNFENLVEVFSKKYKSVVFTSDWSVLDKLTANGTLSEFFKFYRLLLKVGSVGGLFFRGIFFLFLWATCLLGIFYGNVILSLPFVLFFSFYFLIKFILSGVKYLFIFPVFVFLTFILSFLGSISPVLSLFFKKK